MDLSKLNEFYKALDTLNVINSGLDKKREILNNFVADLNSDIEQIKLPQNVRNANRQLANMFDEILDLAKDSIKDWDKMFSQKLEQEKFRSDLENHFIVMIFGRVKAGKSYLGNFIAKNRLPHQDVKFFKYDEAGVKKDIKKLEEIDDECFKTDHLECTSSIQGFKLSGMAWIDTPGLSSTTEVNGELAKEYIDAADYVIYPSSSGAPFQMDEVEELGRIFNMNKKATVIITKSDLIEEDECGCGSECEKCEDGIIKILKNKSSEVRAGQEQSAKETISKIISNKDSMLSEIFSISTKVASEAIQNDCKELFENSNLPKLYEIMTDIMRNKARKLKEETPYEGLRALVKFIINDEEHSVKSIENKISKFKNSILDTKNRLEILENNCLSDVGSLVQNEVSKHGIGIAKENLKDRLRSIDKDIQDKLYNIVRSNLKEIIQNYESSLNELALGLGYEFEIEDKTSEISYSTGKRNKAGMAALFGAIATIGAAIATGGASLTAQFVATAAAGVGGSIVGGKLGEMSGDNVVEKIVVGDNKEEVLANFTASRTEYYTKIAKGEYETLRSRLFTPLENMIADIETALIKFNNKLNKFLKEL